MSEKQLLHEINSSREATEEIRKQVLQAKQKGYFNSTKFGRHFLSTFVPDFAKELLQTTSKTAWGRATTTNIVVAYPLMQEAISLLDPEGYVISVICIKSILDSFGVCKYDLPRTDEAASFIGRRIEDELRTNYYIEVAPESPSSSNQRVKYQRFKPSLQAIRRQKDYRKTTEGQRLDRG